MERYLWRERKRIKELKVAERKCACLATMCTGCVLSMTLLCFVKFFSKFLMTCSDSVFLRILFVAYMVLIVVAGLLYEWFDKKIREII